MSAEEDIYEALMSHVEDLPFSPPIPIAWPNDHYEPVIGTKYIEARHLPNDTQRTMISGDTDRLVGVLLLNLRFPRNYGDDLPSIDAGVIVEHFQTDTVLYSGDTRLRVTRRPIKKEGFEVDGWWITPVLVHYEAFV